LNQAASRRGELGIRHRAAGDYLQEASNGTVLEVNDLDALYVVGRMHRPVTVTARSTGGHKVRYQAENSSLGTVFTLS
jgi:hypothetical protein